MTNLCIYGCGKEGIIKNKSNPGWRCAVSPNSCAGIKAKKRQILIDTYGVTNVSQIPEVLAKKKNTWIENYGVDNPSKAKVIVDKIKDSWEAINTKRKLTMLKKYGTESYNSTDEFKDRRKKTWMEKYGVDNPTKNEEILHKSMLSNAKSEYRTKTLTLPSGKIIRYQGFEDQVIMDLLNSGVHEDDIVTGPGNVPHIKYEFEGKSCRYYPDIYLPKLNKIIEVKSQYTWDKYKERNAAKVAATKSAGFEVEVIIK